MIDPECFRLPWLQAQAERLQVRDKALLERCIHALELVARLRHAGLDFVFKGGTSLVLHLQPIRRLSIDVDIACNASLEEIKRILNAVTYPPRPFKRYVHQEHRDRSEPPTRHFLLSFDSMALPGTESHILLDVLFERSVYPTIQDLPLATDFIETTRDIRVQVPTVDCLLGDKLTAFAPSTIGVRYEPPQNRQGDPMEPQQTRVAKQLYDVSELFGVAHDLNQIRRTYENILEAQNGYRGKNYTLRDTLTDTIDAAYWFSQRDPTHGEPHFKSDFLNQGISNLDSHLIGPGLSVPAAKAAAAKAACLASMLLGNARETMAEIREESRQPQTGDSLTGSYERLRGLRKNAPDAFAYWSIAAGYGL